MKKVLVVLQVLCKCLPLMYGNMDFFRKGDIVLNVTVIGAGNSGLAMAAHLSSEGNNVTLWNRTSSNIEKLIETNTIRCEGVIQGDVKIDKVTDDIKLAVSNPDVIFITTPANSHKELAKLIAENLQKQTLILLNPGRTFGALEFLKEFRKYNKSFQQSVAETQTIVYTCRRTGENSVNIISLKSDVLLSTFDPKENENIIQRLPYCLQQYFIPAKSMIETSIGNVGMVLHCAPLLLNSGWTEAKESTYKYYYDGITRSIGNFIEKIDEERIAVSEILGLKVESTKEWLMRTYQVQGNSIFECIQNNKAYKTIDAPSSINHRYILEDVPCGLVPIEFIGKKYGLPMKNTEIVINLASALLEIDFRESGRKIDYLTEMKELGIGQVY